MMRLSPTSRLTTCAAASKAACASASSPMPQSKTRLSGAASCSASPPGATSIFAGRSSISTMTSSAASLAASGVSATTTAIASPTCLHPVAGQHRPLRRGSGAAVPVLHRGEIHPRLDARLFQILLRQHELHARGVLGIACVEAGDPCMRHGRTDETGMKRALGRDIVDIAALPRQKPDILHALDGLTFSELIHGDALQSAISFARRLGDGAAMSRRLTGAGQSERQRMSVPGAHA